MLGFFLGEMIREAIHEKTTFKMERSHNVKELRKGDLGRGGNHGKGRGSVLLRVERPAELGTVEGAHWKVRVVGPSIHSVGIWVWQKRQGSVLVVFIYGGGLWMVTGIKSIRRVLVLTE